MNLCSGTMMERHEEVCYESNYCPVCEVLGLLEEKNKEIDKLTDRISDLEGK